MWEKHVALNCIQCYKKTIPEAKGISTYASWTKTIVYYSISDAGQWKHSHEVRTLQILLKPSVFLLVRWVTCPLADNVILCFHS